MGLKQDIKDAFYKSMGSPTDDDGNPVEGNIDQLAGDLSKAIIDWTQAQTFTITEMKAILEIEEMSTIGPYTADILPMVTYITFPGGVPGPPAPVTGGKGGVLMSPVNFNKRGGQGGMLKSKGYAYIGNNPVNRGESNEEKTKVKLEKVVAK